MMYIPLTEAMDNLDKHQIFFYIDSNGEKHGGLNHEAVKTAAGDRDTHVCFHDIYHGHMIGPEANCPAKKLREDSEITYKELLETVKRGHNMPTVWHYGTRSKDNGDSPIHQQGSFNKTKIEKMADGRPILQTPLNAFKGHLMSGEYL